MDLHGQLGHNTMNIHKSRFTRIGTDTDWVKVCCGGHHNLALKSNGMIYSWGDNGYGQLGQNYLYTYRSVPSQMFADNDWIDINCGVHSSYGLKSNGTIYSWGMNDQGQLGLGHRWNRPSPQRIGTGSNWRSIFGSGYTALGLRYE
jgi:alpha-tubulin suppressor-like RCC1 family protein